MRMKGGIKSGIKSVNTARGLLFLVVAALVVLLVGTAWARGSLRDVEKLLADEGISAGQGAGIARIYRSALGVDVRGRSLYGLVESCLEGDFDATSIERVLSVVVQLQLSNLPLDDYISKIREGVAKGIPAARILQVAERKALLLKRGGNLLNQIVVAGHEIDDREEILLAVAEALEAGRSEQEIRDILIGGIEKGERTSRIVRALFR